MLQNITSLRKQLYMLKNAERAKVSRRFFKTGKGEYGEGDEFLGIRVPDLRRVAKKFSGLNMLEIETLLTSSLHEERFVALIILIIKYKKATEEERNKLYTFYLNHTRHINNWDLVDVSAEHIVGAYVYDKDKKILEKLAQSKNLWERRIAILSTFHFIKKGTYNETCTIAQILLNDTHDLIHKAVGWMLREVGKRCGQEAEEEFLKTYYRRMPRTMLRYALERFDKKIRARYLKS